MRPVTKPPKLDLAKSAIYNPKEFRAQRRTDIELGEDAASAPRWGAVLLLAVVGIVGWFLWSRSTALLTIPATGVLQQRRDFPGTAAPLKVSGNRQGKHCIFKLEDWQTGAQILAVFVRSGDVAEALVPFGQYRGKISCGINWFGAQGFGPSVVQEELTAPVVFGRNTLGTVTGMTIELTQHLGGNLQSRPIF